MGSVSSSGALQSHPTSNAYSGVVNFASGSIVVGSAPSDAKVTAHAVLVIVGWGLLLPLGVVFARFKEFGNIWFQLHRAFQVPLLSPHVPVQQAHALLALHTIAWAQTLLAC